MDSGSELNINELKSKLKKHHFFPYTSPYQLSSLHKVFDIFPWENKDEDGNMDEIHDEDEYVLLVDEDKDLHEDQILELMELFDTDDTVDSFCSRDSSDLLPLLMGKDNDQYLVRYGSGERVKAEDVLKDKYVLVFCFFVPSFWRSDCAYVSWGMSALCAEFGARKRDEVEMVMVAKMRPEWDGDEDAFNQFFSAFPDCLAVPFEDKHRRECMFKTLCCADELYNGVLFNPEQKVVVERVHHVYKYGVDAFPFTIESLGAYGEKDQELLSSRGPGTLEKLLGCRFLRHNIVGDLVPISEIERNPVGLYFCCRGGFFKELGELYQQCRDNGLAIEIVVICSAYLSLLEQSKFQKLVECALKKKNISCYILPFDNSVFSRLRWWADLCTDDKLLVLTPGNSLETYGEEVFRTFGINGYPFTKRGIFEREVERLRKLEWKSIVSLLPQNVSRKNSNSQIVEVPVASLEGKNILLYLDYTWYYCKKEVLVEYGDDLVRWYDEIKRKHPDFEMLFICLESNSNRSLYDHESVYRIPWLVCPYDPIYSVSLANKLDEHIYTRKCTLVAFGEDGKICSLPHLAVTLDVDLDPFQENLENSVDAFLKIHYGTFSEYNEWRFV